MLQSNVLHLLLFYLSSGVTRRSHSSEAAAGWKPTGQNPLELWSCGGLFTPPYRTGQSSKWLFKIALIDFVNTKEITITLLVTGRMSSRSWWRLSHYIMQTLFWGALLQLLFPLPSFSPFSCPQALISEGWRATPLCKFALFPKGNPSLQCIALHLWRVLTGGG